MQLHVKGVLLFANIPISRVRDMSTFGMARKLDLALPEHQSNLIWKLE